MQAQLCAPEILDRSASWLAPTPVKVLLILGHPRKSSLCGALANAYVAGAREAGADVRCLAVADMEFDPNVVVPSPRHQLAEASVGEAMELVAWADHLVLVFPTWWGTMPAALKGFLDRVLIPGFAFEEHEDEDGWEKLLVGKSAHLLTTMDTPRWVYRWIYKAPGLNSLSRATLGFCGIAPVRSSIFGPVRGSEPQQRARWIEQARQEGLRLRTGAPGKIESWHSRIFAWITALRLQFYPMVWTAYGIGAAGATQATGSFAPLPFWLGLLSLFLLEVATVFTNDYVDLESDRCNRHHGPFTGGSRVLVDGKITLAQMRFGIAAAIGIFVIAAFVLNAVAPGARPLLLLATLAVLTLGYTAPPLKLCWRGLGEIDVALTHSFAVVLCGYAFQGGAWDAVFPWLIGVPLFWAVLPAITLSGIPDYAADLAVGKATLAVQLGPKRAIVAAQAATALAALLALVWEYNAIASGAYAGIGFIVVPHATLQIILLQRYAQRRRKPGRIDGLMALSLLYIVWFVAVPLWNLAIQ